MTYAAVRDKTGTQPFALVELALDSGTITFCQNSNVMPNGLGFIPALVSYDITPTRLSPGKGLGDRGKLTVTFSDIPETTGTYFGKLLANNPYWLGRECTLKLSYIDSSGYDAGNFQDRKYIIESIDGPDSRGRVRLVAMDLLKMTNGDRAQIPAATSGVSLTAITDSYTGTFTLTPTGIGNDQYAASGNLIWDDEIMSFTRSGDVMTIVARGLRDTVAEAHEAGEVIQQVAKFDAVNIVDVVEELLVDYCGVDPSYIDTTGFADQQATFLRGDVTGEIIKPEGVDSILEELQRDFCFDLWYDERDQLIKIKAITPTLANAQPTSITDELHMLDDSISVVRDLREQLTEVWVFYGRRSPTEDLSKSKNYRYLSISAAPTTAASYGRDMIKKIYSRFIVSESTALTCGGRTLNRFKDGTTRITFKTDASLNDTWTGEEFNISTRLIQDVSGNNNTTRAQVISAREVNGHTVEYVTQANPFTGRYAFIAPSGQADYSASTAGDRLAYAFIANSSNVIPYDSSEAYKII